jgi:hypothetical protein
MIYFFVVIGLIEFYYWFIYFPRAMKNGSNLEINDLAYGLKKLYGKDSDLNK